MKMAIFLLLLLTSVMATARPCEVYGISDSPQKLDCTFKRLNLPLRCVNGKYFIGESVVRTAYHEEVEDGPVPLVFKAQDMTLTVLMFEKADIEAELVKNGKRFTGKCQ